MNHIALPSLDVDGVLGLAVAVVCITLALGYLLLSAWPEPAARYRGVALAATFLLVASWSAAGLSGVADGFWTFANFGVLVALVGGTWWAFRSWYRSHPIPGQKYKLRGLEGLVEVLETRGETVVDGVVTYRLGDARTTLHVLRFVCQAELVEPTPPKGRKP